MDLDDFLRGAGLGLVGRPGGINGKYPSDLLCVSWVNGSGVGGLIKCGGLSKNG